MADFIQDTNELTTITLAGPEMLMRNWQQAGLRILRAQERLLNGIVNAAKLELQFSQDLVTHRMSLLSPENITPKQSSEHAVQELERLVTLFRSVSEELRHGFSEASKLLTEGAAPEMQQAIQNGINMQENMAQNTDETTQTVASIARKAAAKAREAMPNPPSEGPATGEGEAPV